MSDAARHGGDSASGVAQSIRPGALFRGLIQEFAQGFGVHAYLLTGPRGVGKRTLARQCAMAALCQGVQKPCFSCSACVRFLDDAHPDVKVIAGEKTIGVDAIREAVRLSGEHAFEGGRRVILIEQAEKMTPQAQNCLLKTLEEPPADTLFLLVAQEASSLLPTVVSRCRQRPVPPWPKEEMEPVLLSLGVPKERLAELCQLSGGSVGAAMQWWRDPAYAKLRESVLQKVLPLLDPAEIIAFCAAMREEKEQAEDFLDMLEILIREVLLCRLGQRGESALADFPAAWRWAGESAPLASLQRILDAIFTARRRRASQVSWQAALEELLLNIMEEVNAWQQ